MTITKARRLRSDLRRLRSRAFRQYDQCAALLPRLHRLAGRDGGENSDIAVRLYDWLLVPVTLWPIDVAGAAAHFVEAITAARHLDEDFRFLVDLLGPPPKTATQDEIELFEHYVKKGSYDHLIRCPEKFEALEEVLAYDERLRLAWARLKRSFNVDKHAKNGVIRRRMSEERNFRSSWAFQWKSPQQRFVLLFDALCYRWQLYGIEKDKPLLLKLSVNPTPHGTLIMVPRLLSLDGDRDLKWRAIGRLHRAHGAPRQGRKASRNRAAMYREAVEIVKHEAVGRADGLKGKALTAYILDQMKKHPGTDESWIKRRVRLVRELWR